MLNQIKLVDMSIIYLSRPIIVIRTSIFPTLTPYSTDKIQKFASLIP